MDLSINDVCKLLSQHRAALDMVIMPVLSRELSLLDSALWHSSGHNLFTAAVKWPSISLCLFKSDRAFSSLVGAMYISFMGRVVVRCDQVV